MDKEKFKFIEKWCKKHNATWTRIMEKGFTYMLPNGTEWYIQYDEM